MLHSPHTAHTKRLSVAALLLSLALLLSACASPDQSQEDTETTTALITSDTVAPPVEEPDVVDASDTAYSYTDMEEDLQALADAHPSLLSVHSAGQSHDGRELYYAMMGTEDAASTVMIQAGIHGREYLTPLLVMRQLEYYLDHYDETDANGTSYRKILADFRFCVVPMINPDGIMLSEEGLDAIRSETLRREIETIYLKDVRTSPDLAEYFGDINAYLRLWKANARGVDLNRNFGIDEWEEIKSRSYPSLQSYKGPTPNSEQETQAMIALSEGLENLVCSVSYHSQGEIIYWDSGQEGKVRDTSIALTELAATLTGYDKQESFTAPDGTYNDWSMLKLAVPSIILETGLGDCPLPHEQFECIWEKNYLLWARIAEEWQSVAA